MFGNVFPAYKLPALPAGSTMTVEQYHATASTLFGQKLASSGVAGVKNNWIANAVAPADQAAFPGYLLDRLDEAGIDKTHVTVPDPSPNGEVEYCWTTGSEIRCYETYDPVWTGGGVDPFVFTITTGPGVTVDVRVRFTVQLLS